MPRLRLHSRDASPFGQSRARVGSATPAAAQRVCAPHGPCAGNAHPPGAATPAAPLERIRPHNRYCRGRRRCRCSPACRSPGIRSAGKSSHAPHAHQTLDKSVRRAHNTQADPAVQAPHRRPGVDRENPAPGLHLNRALRSKNTEDRQRQSSVRRSALRQLPNLGKPASRSDALRR
jgi:hypothetical protein